MDLHGRWLFEVLYLCFVSEVWGESIDQIDYLWKCQVTDIFKNFPVELRTPYVLHQLEQAIYVENTAERWTYWMSFFQELGWLGYIGIHEWDEKNKPIYVPRITTVYSNDSKENLLKTTHALSYTIYMPPLLKREALIEMMKELQYIYKNPQTHETRQWMDICEIFRFYLKHTENVNRLYTSIFMYGLCDVYAHRTTQFYLETPVVTYALYGLFLGIAIKWDNKCYIPYPFPSNIQPIQVKPECYDVTYKSIQILMLSWDIDEVLCKQKGIVPIPIKVWYIQLFRFTMLLIMLLYPDMDESQRLNHPWLKRIMDHSMSLSESNIFAKETMYLFHMTRIIHQVIESYIQDEQFKVLWNEFRIWTTVDCSTNEISEVFLRRHLHLKKIKPVCKSSWILAWFHSKIAPKEFDILEYKQFALASWLMMDCLNTS